MMNTRSMGGRSRLLAALSIALPILTDATCRGQEADHVDAPLLSESFRHNFGQVYQKQKMSHVFKFRNTRKKPLTIEKVTSACHCSHHLLSNRIIPPDGVAQIEVTFDSGSFKGKIERTISVLTNDSQYKVVKLNIRAVVLESNASIVPKHVFFGNVKRQERFKRTISLSQRGPELLDITKVESSAEFLRAKLENAEPESEKTKAENNEESETRNGERKNPKSSYEIVIALDGEKAPIGRFLEFITIYTTSERFPLYDVMVKGNVK